MRRLAHASANHYAAASVRRPGGVTKPSLLAREALNPLVARNDALFFPLAYAFFLCESHERLTGNINFQDNLLNVLLDREHPWDASRELRR